jgi:hypothetical protein
MITGSFKQGRIWSLQVKTMETVALRDKLLFVFGHHLINEFRFSAYFDV